MTTPSCNSSSSVGFFRGCRLLAFRLTLPPFLWPSLYRRQFQTAATGGKHQRIFGFETEPTANTCRNNNLPPRANGLVIQHIRCSRLLFPALLSSFDVLFQSLLNHFVVVAVLIKCNTPAGLDKVFAEKIAGLNTLDFTRLLIS